jgi:hypothetical protein
MSAALRGWRSSAPQRRRRAGQAAPAAARHDGGQAQHARRELGSQQLGDHAAHRHPDHVGARDPEGRQHADGVAGHVFELVRAGGPAAQQRLHPGQREIRRAGLFEFGRQAAIAVVEADHVEAELDQAIDELVRPGGQLQAEPGDQQQRSGFRVACGVEGDADAVGVQAGHGGTLGPRVTQCRLERRLGPAYHFRQAGALRDEMCAA